MLGQKLSRKEHTFDDECDFTWENLYSNFDHYYVAHLLGWFVLTFVVRDRFVIHSWAMMDELVELSWQHILPHLRECWWDHVFIDILFSNTVGIELALLVIKLLKIKRHDWLGKEGAKSWREWKVFTCHRHFGLLMAFYIFVVARFLGMFFLMNALFLPPRHFVSVLRVIGWAFFAFLPIGEIYEDIRTWNTPERKKCQLEGNYRWLGMGSIFMECLVSYKFRLGTGHMIEDAATPIHIVVIWVIASTGALSFYLYLRFKKDHTRKVKEPAPLPALSKSKHD